MKTIILTAFFTLFVALSAFCGGNLELVNTQEFELDSIIDVKVLYSSEKVSVFMGTTDTLIIKEYMSENNSQYFARITNSGNTITIENGRSPFRPIFNFFSRRLEVYLPLSYRNSVSIKTSSGKIDASDLFCSKLAIESSSGHISVKSITADTINIKASSGRIDIGNIIGEISTETSSGRINIIQVTGNLTSKTASGNIHGEKIQGNADLRTNSGSINFGIIEGNISTETSSGNIELSLVNGSVNAKTSSGGIRCTMGTHTGDISLNTSSGNVRLNLPRDLQFSFTSRTSSGKLSTPFSDRLSNPVTDRNLTQGIIGSNNGSEEISTVNIRTNSGSIKIEWT
jgi:DUF4097 and DUF4098 domain-containing protein YvlB